MPRKPENLNGKRFNMLTVECITDQRNNYGRILYKCRCDCGGERLATAANLKRGEIKDCGCTRDPKKDISGQRFGKLTAVKAVGRGAGKMRSYNWLCMCDCGCETIVNVNALTSGRTKSCGCLKIEKVKSLYQDGTSPCKLNESKKQPRQSNTSGYTGVYYDNTRKLWVADIMFKKKKIYIGRFAKKEDAIRARKMSEERIFGEYLDDLKP